MSAAAILLTPLNTTFLADRSSCLSSSYYGTYRDNHDYHSVFVPEASCLDSWTVDNAAQLAAPFDESPVIFQAKQSLQQLVWVEEKDVSWTLYEDIPSFYDELDLFLQRLGQDYDGATSSEQDVLVHHPTKSYEVLHRLRRSALLSVNASKARNIDSILPRFLKSTPLPTVPMQYVPVSSAATARVKHVLSSLQFDPDIAAIVNSISIDQIKNDIRFLTGEDGKSGIVSRHSFADGSRVAAEWLKERIEGTGATCELKTFLTGFAPNVVCRYAALANTTETVLISAHYDSRGSFGSTRAPGGDDDGSGTTGILNIARAIGAKGIQFDSNVELVLFAGEEQGLLGSRAYARELQANDANLTLVIQADMTAYHHPDEPAQLGLPATIGSPEVADLVKVIASKYSPELTVGYTGACCSDHQSFHELGFPATQVFERAGSIIDPMYHNSGDLSDRIGYDFDQLKSIAKVQFATVLHVAGYTFTK